MKYRAFAFIAALMSTSATSAQVVTSLTDPTYLAVVSTSITPSRPGSCGPAQPNGAQYCLSDLQGIPVSYFATSASMISLNNQLNSLSTQMRSQFSKAFELSAISSAMGDAIPNPGDRFALRINAAGFNGEAAGALGLSYNITDSARLSINYGQGRSQSVVSGGMNFSFR